MSKFKSAIKHSNRSKRCDHKKDRMVIKQNIKSTMDGKDEIFSKRGYGWCKSGINRPTNKKLNIKYRNVERDIKYERNLV